MKNKFQAAFIGLRLCFGDKSIRLQLIIALMVAIGGLLIQLTLNQWIMVISAIGLVVVAEVLNTCIEKVCDLIDSNYNEKIKVIKDLGAAGVLLASFYAIIMACLITLMKLGVIV